MSEPKFPKGPWRANAWNILNSYGSRIIQLFPFQYPDTADMALRDLLLAAPDMYEALECACDQYCIGYAGDSIVKCEDCIIGNALRKARGEAE